MKAKQGLKTGVVFVLALLLFGSCKEEELYTINEFTKLACTFHDKSIPNGQSVIAYSAESLVYDAKCSSVAETRTCEDGELSGTFEFNSCVEEPPATCTFDNKTVEHDGFVTAYSSSLVEWDESCGDRKETRVCDNGTLSNIEYVYPTCDKKVPDNCTTISGQFVEHTKSIEAFSESSTVFDDKCTDFRVDLECENGVFVNHNATTYQYPTCADGEPSDCELAGITKEHNDAYLFALASSVPYNSTCSYQTRVCKNGSFDGNSNYKYADCEPEKPINCTYTDTGNTLLHSFSAALLYSDNESDYPDKCTDIDDTNISCTNGVFSKASYTYENCQDGVPKNCTMTDNNSNSVTIYDNNSTVAYRDYSVGFNDSCSDISENLTCLNGSLFLNGIVTTAYPYTACSSGPPRSCNFGGTKAHESSFSAYSTSLIDWDASKVGLEDPCIDNRTTLTCNDSLVSGVDNLTHTFATCSMREALDCDGPRSLDGREVNHGDSVTAYKYNSSGNGGDCSDTKVLTCTNGSFDDPAYQYDHCLNEVVLVGARGTSASKVELTWIPLDNESNYYQEYFAESGYILDEIPESEVSIQITHADGVAIGPHSVTTSPFNGQLPSGSKTLSVYVIIDDSKSMKTNDSSDLRYTAVNDLIDVLPIGTDLKIVDYTRLDSDEEIDYIVKDSNLTDKESRKNEVNSKKSSSYPNTPLWNSMWQAAFEIVSKDRRLLITLSDGKNYTEYTTTAETARKKIDGKLAEIHNIGLYSGADPIDIEFKQMPNNAANGGSYREVDNASDLSGLFSNLGKTASIGYARPSSSIDNISFTFTSNVKYTGILTIRGIQNEFTFTY